MVDDLCDHAKICMIKTDTEQLSPRVGKWNVARAKRSIRESETSQSQALTSSLMGFDAVKIPMVSPFSSFFGLIFIPNF